MNSSSASIYTDFQGLSELKARAGRDADASLNEVARQFESLLISQMLKGMRQTSMGEGMMESDQSLFYRDMYDQQLAIHMAESGGMGLAEVITRQMGGEADKLPSTISTVKDMADYRQQAVAMAEMRADERRAVGKQQAQASTPTTASNAVAAAADTTQKDPASWTAEEFVETLWPWAREAAAMLGLEPQALLAQAALETGWGKHQMRLADGSPANNLFGIKADHRWSGEHATVETLEYEQGVAVRKRANFRAYDSYQESFNDYVNFLSSSPRYQETLEKTGDSSAYFTSLQQAGYATDPKYAEKINRLLEGPEMSRALARLKTQVSQPL